ncbi:hypothetical protein LCGC14_0248800 [marine sediment metagenome]|uniref:Uncharacterized protein n=1 Tax=marine sediment metagenome TaxID=412755 RepID=A0A0F9X9P8_9ZZZZ
MNAPDPANEPQTPIGECLEPFDFLVKPGDATSEELSKLFMSLSDLWKLTGGQSLAFSVVESRDTADGGIVKVRATPTDFGVPAEQVEPRAPMAKIDKAIATLEAVVQPDVFARLEAWLRGESGRKIIVNEMGDSGFEVVLRVSSRELDVVASERETSFVDALIAKAPGLAATIEAALEKVEKEEL